MLVVKIGGSVITYKKSRKPRLNKKNLQRIAKEIGKAYEEMDSGVVIIHGAGSYGHPIVKRTGIGDGIKNNKQLIDFAETQRLQKRARLLWWCRGSEQVPDVVALYTARANVILDVVQSTHGYIFYIDNSLFLYRNSKRQCVVNDISDKLHVRALRLSELVHLQMSSSDTKTMVRLVNFHIGGSLEAYVCYRMISDSKRI